METLLLDTIMPNGKKAPRVHRRVALLESMGDNHGTQGRERQQRSRW